MRRALLVSLLFGLIATTARADQVGECHTVDIQLTPTANLQIVAWIEDTAGNYVDTAYITQATGSYGIGNRPGRFDFNSGPLWPYGRRITTFPVWAHKNGMSFPEIDFQDGLDSNLSHPVNISSHEAHFCRPMQDHGADQNSWDTGTCATPNAFSDKGHMSPSKTTGYPPRTDLRHQNADSTDVDEYAALDPFDAISQATPQGDVPATLVWSTPSTVPDGSYVLFVEVNKEFDQNASYDATKYPSPNVAYGDYGEAYRGQPSVLYSLPITIGTTDSSGQAAAYIGYGDPDGVDGDIRPPDATISTTVPGSGASRLAMTPDGFRIKADAHVQFDSIAPAAIPVLASQDAGNGTRISFRAPGDDGNTGQVNGYDIRLSPGVPITDANFSTMTRVPTPANPVGPGDTQTFDLPNLLPDSDYYVGVKPLDDCHNVGPLTTLEFHTSAGGGEVDACFIATAAYGSVMVRDVGMLRQFRDQMLKKSVLGELFVESYYTFGPPVAHVVNESEVLRATARAILTPIIDRVRPLVRI